MSEPGFATEEVRRVVARDDLLTMAAAADEAVSIVGNQVALARRTKDDPSLYVIALERYLAVARGGRLWSARAQAWDSAAVIVRFGEMVDMRPDCAETPEQMHANALAELAPGAGSRLDKDLALGVIGRYHAARNLRLAGDFDGALDLVMRPRTDLYGTGAEPHMAHYLFERGAGLLAQGQADQVADALLEWVGYWERTRARGYSTRYRFDFLRALVYWESEEHGEGEVREQLDAALGRLRDGAPVPVLTAAGDLRESATDHGVRELSVALTKAEFLAATARSDAARQEAAGLGRWALGIANRVRGRMRVIARSRAPLAAAFRRLYGDIALLADRLAAAGTPGAAELGLEVALAAKQTGFAARIRADRGLMNGYVQGVLDEIVEIENRLDAGADFASTPHQRAERLDQLHFKLGDKVSAMLAETVLPSPVNLADLTGALGQRYALDYLELPDSLGGRPALYRSLLRPGRPAVFERFEPAPAVAEFFADHRAARDLVDGVGRDTRVRRSGGARAARPTWRSMAGLLPAALRDELAAGRDEPVPLVVSAHSWLSLVPWAAVTLEDGARLVERALITQTPVLTCLTTPGAPPVAGRALVRLVGTDAPGEHGVDVAEERTAWGLPAGPAGVPLSAAQVRSAEAPERLADTPRLADVLTGRGAWAFLHVASHGGRGVGQEAGGDHDGLRQELRLPEQRLTAARALSLHWPTSVLMASCHVGQVVNARDAEPLNFVMAVLTGGAECVVAGMAAIGDRETGNVARDMVNAIRGAGRPLDEALRAAQLAAIARDADEAGWALLAAYVR
ncbi:CHAT domain-containing protein [Dactylosporangium darangshiense]|uniref:CHAT domain-containing protein n=1 Tax=Dactylosporangium darangshiense TaxID=579108 RepID=A0ABP8DLZ5_9ACTN